MKERVASDRLRGQVLGMLALTCFVCCLKGGWVLSCVVCGTEEMNCRPESGCLTTPTQLPTHDSVTYPLFPLSPLPPSLSYFLYLSYVYIEALEPYSIDRVLIL